MKITKFTSTTLISTVLIAGQLQAAPAIKPETQPLGTIGPIELSNTDLSVGGVRAYRGWFENGNWQGDLIEYSVSPEGLLETSINADGQSPVAGTANSQGVLNWSAYLQLGKKAADWWSKDTGTDRRKIFTANSDNGNQVPFRWASLSDDQRAHLIDSDILDYLRGDRKNEAASGTGEGWRYRLPETGVPMGDIVHSNPEYVGTPEDAFTETSYVDFKNKWLDRKGRVYVGANDGMLHAFDADTGDEVWAYVPSMLFHKLTVLLGQPYAHTYFVDGGITVRDAKLGSNWSTVLIGSLGAGAKGLYALDVTDPGLTDETATGKLLVEVSADNATYGNDIGYIFDATTIAKLNDGKWYAVNGNGISSANGVAKLLLLNLATGAVTMISTSSGTSGDPNGLSAPALLDTDGDGKTDFAYAGDVNGDMWKFDLSKASPGDWGVDYKLYDGTPAQPITMAPDITRHPNVGYLVLFGTGKLYEVKDVEDSKVQGIYGIWDKGGPAGTKISQVLSGDISATFSGTDADGNSTTNSELVRTFNPVVRISDFNTYPGGWHIALPGGERVLTPPALRAGRLKTTVTNPDGFANWFLEATFDEGTAAEANIFDLNRDGDLTGTADRVLGNSDSDYDDQEDIPMGWKRPDGNMSQVTVARLGAGQDTLFLNFLNPPLIEAPEPCSGSCGGGLIGGHIDVDNDHGGPPAAVKKKDKDGNNVIEFIGDGFGGKTDTHKHTYDVTHNRTYIDYFDIDPKGEGKPIAPTDIITNQNQKFIVLIANADWSPGGILTIGDVEYNVVVYQAMLHQALANWKIRDGSDGRPAETKLLDEDLTDPVGNPLVHSLKSIQDDLDSDGNAGTLRMTFLATALQYGGLVPSKTSCVKDELKKIMNRFRGNALVTHLVDADYVKNIGTGQPLDRLRVQDPTTTEAGVKAPGTFYERVILSDGTMVRLTDDKDNDGVEGDGPEYEVYGGLTAANDASLLYETTVFWHWKDNPQPDVCWDDSDFYRTEFKKWTNRTAIGIFLDKLTDQTVFESFEELVLALKDLETKGCRETTDSCKDYDKYKDLYTEGLLVMQVPGGSGLGEDDGFVEGQTGSLTGKPVVIPGGVSKGGLTSGPNFETGRRTWIDILPQ